MFKKRLVKKSNVSISFDEPSTKIPVVDQEESGGSDTEVEKTRARLISERDDIRIDYSDVSSDGQSENEGNSRIVLNAASMRKKFKKSQGGAGNSVAGKGKQTEESLEQAAAQETVKQLIDEEFEDLKYKSTASLLGNSKDLAAVHNEIDTDQSIDARAIALKRLEISKQVREGKLSGDIYRGKNYSTIYTTKTEEEIRKSKITGSLGPVRAPANVRMTCRFDFDPSLCKDYHDTGYCVFGDSCLYLHDRGDYKNGQEQEREWLNEQKKKKQAIQDGVDFEADEEAEEISTKLDEFQVPKNCGICQGKIRNPVKTVCNHFFCEDCALRRYGSSKTCAVCNRLTQGVFADAVNAIIKMRKERNEEKKKLIKNASSQKAFEMLEDSEDEDDEEKEAALKIKRRERKIQQKQLNEKPQEKKKERVYIDESGIEITEMVLDDEPEEDMSDSQEGDQYQVNKERDQQEDEQSSNEDHEEESEQDIIADKAEREAIFALNQLRKKKSTANAWANKKTASDWVI